VDAIGVIKNLMLRVGADFSAVTTQSKKASQSMGSMMSAINRSTSKLNSAISGMNKVLGAAGIAVSLAGIVSAAKNAAAAFNEVQENNAALAQVMKNTMGATKEQWRSVLDLADAQQRLGVIDAEVTKAGAVELATYLGLSDSLEMLLPVMNDMLAQQYGMAASSENAANIATMLGKVMNGQTGALSRYGYSFTAAQEAILKYGDEAQRAAVLAQVVEESVGGMNRALAQTPAGRLQQVKFALGDIQEQFGKAVMTIATAFLPLLNTVAAALQRIAAWAGRVAQAIANVFGMKTKTVAAAGGGIGAAASGINDAADAGDNLSDAMGGAAKNTEKAAKAARKLSSLGIDELNLLTDPSTATDAASGGGSGTGGLGDVGGGFTGIDWDAAEEAGESSTALEKILRRLKATVDKMDFSRLEAAWGRLKESAKALGDTIKVSLGPVYDEILEPLTIWAAEVAIPNSLDWFAKGLDSLRDAIAGVDDFLSGKTVDTTSLYNAIGGIGDFFGIKAFSMIGNTGKLMEKFDSLRVLVDDVCHALQMTLQGLEDFISDIPGWFANNIKAPIVNEIQTIVNKVQSAVAKIQNAIATVRQFFGLSSMFNTSGKGGSSTWGKVGKFGSAFLAPHFAEGGVMQSAGLFWANENGSAEMVGRFGSHVGVANSDQIVSGIRMGVSDANDGVITAIYAVAQQIITAMREQEGRGGDLDLGRLIAQQQRNSARLNG
jgi:hypothetical protein